MPVMLKVISEVQWYLQGFIRSRLDTADQEMLYSPTRGVHAGVTPFRTGNQIPLIGDCQQLHNCQGNNWIEADLSAI